MMVRAEMLSELIEDEDGEHKLRKKPVEEVKPEGRQLAFSYSQPHPRERQRSNSSRCPESQHEVRASCESESESRSARVERSDGQEQRDLESWRDVELGWRSDLEMLAEWKRWQSGDAGRVEMLAECKDFRVPFILAKDDMTKVAEEARAERCHSLGATRDLRSQGGAPGGEESLTEERA
jgi:hypothetical protein